MVIRVAPQALEKEICHFRGSTLAVSVRENANFGKQIH
jgi:hypothetical protein